MLFYLLKQDEIIELTSNHKLCMNGNYRYPCKGPVCLLKQKMKLRNFSGKTIKSYLYYITDILKSKGNNPKNINSDDLRKY